MLALKVVLFILFVQATALLWIPYFIVHACGEHVVFDWRALTGLVAITLGGMAVLMCDWDFAASGKGTPAPIDPPRTLVRRGLYRVVRNPMYVGVVTVLLGESLVFNSVCLLVYAIGLWLAFHLFVVLYEEPTLRRMFGRNTKTTVRPCRDGFLDYELGTTNPTPPPRALRLAPPKRLLTPFLLFSGRLRRGILSFGDKLYSFQIS